MEKKYVRVANTVLDLEPMDSQTKDRGDHGSRTQVTGSRYRSTKVAPSPEVISALKYHLDKDLLSLQPDPDATALKAAISEYIAFPSENIACFPGEYMALDYIARTFLESGTEILISGPVPPEKQISAAAAGASVVEVIHDNPFHPSLEQIINNIGKRTRVLYLGNPSEYVGSFFTEAELIFLLAYAENSMIVVDESYFEYSGFTVANLVRKFPNLTVLRSFSRALGLAGFNVSYIISDSENLGYINRLAAGNPIDLISQTAARAALTDLHYLQKRIDTINESKELISANLPGFGYDFYIPPTDFFVLSVSDFLTACDYLRENGVSAIDLSEFRHLEGFMRIGIGVREETEQLLLLLGRMAEKFATAYNRNRLKKSPDSRKQGISTKTSLK